MAITYQYSDFDIDLNKNSFIDDIAMVKDRNAIRQSIMNIILTRPGEKPFDRNFGVGLHNYLFELMSPITIAKLERDIIWAVNGYEPRARIDRVVVNGDNIDDNEVDITIRFSILSGNSSTPNKDVIQISLTKVR